MDQSLHVAADTAYGSAEMLDWLTHDQGIELHIPAIDKAERIDGTLSRSDFAYDHAQDLYRCPADKALMQAQRAYSTRRTSMVPDETLR